MSRGDKVDLSSDIQKTKDSINGKEYVESRLGHELKTTKRYACPFCHAKHSFSYYCKDGDKFKCHACSWHGDFIAFEQRYSNVTFPQALKIIAQNAGITHFFFERETCSVAAKTVKPEPEPSKKKLPKSPPKTNAPTFSQIHKQIANTDYTDIADNLVTWLISRGFGNFAKHAAEIAAHSGIRVVKVFSGKVTNLAFPAQNANNEIVGYQRAEYPAGKLHKGWYTGSDTKSIFVIDQNSDIVFMVEAVANAQALACIDYSTVALFGTSGVSNIPLVKARFPNKRLILWLDKGVEEIQRKAMQDCGVEGIFWEDSLKKGYDQNDLIRDRQADFERAVEGYIATLPKPTVRQTIARAFSGWTDTKQIVALPGSGKTYQTMLKVLEAIEKNIPILYVANNTKDLADFDKELRQKTKAKVLLLKGGRKALDEDLITTDQSGEKLSSYKFILTHKTYIQRKGLGSKYYNLLNWIIQQRPFVVIDESNEYLKSLKKLVPLSLMSHVAHRKGKKEPFVTVYHENPNYKSQAYKLHIYQPCYNLKFDIDKYGNANLLLPSSDLEAQKVVRLGFDLGQKTDLAEVNYSVTLIKQKLGYIEKKLDEYASHTKQIPTQYADNEFFDRNDLQDIIECSLNPAIIEVYPTLNGKKFEHYEGVDEVTKAKVKQPSRAFGEYLRLFDLFPLSVIAKFARGVRFLCTHENKEFVSILNRIFPKVEVVHAERQAEKLDGVFVIGFAKECANITEQIQAIKTLIFERNDKAVDLKFAKTDNDVPIGKVKESEVEPKRKFTDQELFFMLANPFGNLGKAVNLPQYQVNFVNAGLHEPFIANTEFATKAEVLAKIKENRIELLWQCAARILRGHGKKVVVFYSVTQEDFRQLLSSLNLDEVAQQHHTRYLTHEESLVYEVANAYIKGGNLVNRQETLSKPIAKENLTPKQRIVRKEELDAIANQKEKERMERLENEVIKAARNKVSWRGSVAKYHIHRLDSEQKKKLRFMYDSNSPQNGA